MVGDIDKNSISFSNINSRPWKPPIYSYNGFSMAQSTHILHLNLKKATQKKIIQNDHPIEKPAKESFVHANDK